MLTKKAVALCTDARGPTSESMEETILCIDEVLMLSFLTDGLVRVLSRLKHRAPNLFGLNECCV